MCHWNSLSKSVSVDMLVHSEADETSWWAWSLYRKNRSIGSWPNHNGHAKSMGGRTRKIGAEIGPK
jgi:hypothetical protein